MKDLPFVLVHGPWIWKFAVVALTALVLGLVSWRRRWRARRGVRDTLRAIDQGTESDGVLRGKLGGQGILAATLIVERWYDEPERLHWRADKLWLETAQGRVAIDGNAIVELGSRGIARRTRMPAMPEPLARAATETRMFSALRLLTLHGGDEVIVRGELHRAPAGDGGFRDGKVDWSIRPTESAPIRLAARAPRPALLRMTVWAILIIGGGTALAGYKLVDTLGNSWRDGCWDRDRYADRDGFVELSTTDRCILAAATPDRQESAYQTLFNALESHPYRDQRSLDRLVSLAETTGGCERAIEVLQSHGRSEELLVEARKCRRSDAEHDALFALGRYDEAARTARPSIYTLIAAERWEQAAVFADERAGESHESADDNTYHMRDKHYRCLAELFRFYAGDAEALPKLRAAVEEPMGAVCEPMLVEALPDAERAAHLETFDSSRSHLYETTRFIDVQAMLAGRHVPLEAESAERTLVKLDDAMGQVASPLVWAAKLAPPAGSQATTGGTPAQRTAMLRWQTVGKVLDGDIAGAEKTAAEAAALARQAVDVDPYPIRDAPLLPATVALFSKHVVDIDLQSDDLMIVNKDLDYYFRESWYFRFGRLHLRANRSIDDAYFGPDADYVDALRNAQRGNALPLATYVVKGRWWSDGDIMAVWPHLTAGKERLLSQLPWVSSYTAWRYVNRAPFDVAAAAVVRREMFRVAGDEQQAAYWNGLYQRIARALDRKRVMALMFWDL